MNIFALCEILVPQLDTIGVVDVLDNLMFSVLVALILEDLLDGDGLLGLAVDGLLEIGLPGRPPRRCRCPPVG